MAEPPGLGEPVRTFDARPARRRALTWLIALVVAVVALVPAAVAAFLSGAAWLGAPLTVIAMGCAAAAGWIAGRGTVWRRAPVVHLFTGGLVVSPAPGPAGAARDGPQGAGAPARRAVAGLRGDGGTWGDAAPEVLAARGLDGDASVFVWDDLVSVTVSGVRPWDGGAGAVNGTRWSFTVVSSDGRVLRFGDELPGVRALGETIAAEVTRRAVPRHLAAVEAGEAVRLGPFTVDLGGVEKDGQRVPWQAVRGVGIGGGLVTVHSCGGRPDLAAVAGHMPDALPFTLLCDRIKELLGPG
ncbi:hypothetical protein F8568_042895 [Actinomadura sp. LD22]|uniref:Uncharacterized protein n=1 Tax=Actinomadura physcomitrii TaxID=2650748 RepID=A0A6I4MSY9_9ACTN|nr:DUF6585 family protein [Actinomadura physcomitrii]MWA06977.1 hypothetical protein [Actinomadura physcomitrii]